ncbi:MAG TPA: hypothetical protein VL727_14195 [Puia sp.]|nr:hypothetical protein [Puia sp.]
MSIPERSERNEREKARDEAFRSSDRPPNEYKATSYWGVDAQSGLFQAYTFDNFHGHRQFVSNGWIRGKIILSTQSVSGTTIFFEHFIYEFVSDKQFKMKYQVSGDGINWQLGDSLTFHRVAG